MIFSCNNPEYFLFDGRCFLGVRKCSTLTIIKEDESNRSQEVLRICDLMRKEKNNCSAVLCEVLRQYLFHVY